MRRMYSEKELTTIIKEVSEAYIDELIEQGVFNDKINEYVDAYLDENPITPSDLDFSSIDFVAKTINQLNANESANLSYSSETGLDITNIYSRAEVIGNVLYFVGSIKVENTTGSAISYTCSTITFALSDAVSSKIYDVTGLALTETGTIFTRVCDFIAIMNEVAQIGSGAVTTKIMTLMRSGTNKNLSIRTLSGESFSIPANSTRYISFRTQLTLL